MFILSVVASSDLAFSPCTLCDFKIVCLSARLFKKDNFSAAIGRMDEM